MSNKWMHTLGSTLLPAYVKPYVTFRWTTLFVVTLFVWVSLLRRSLHPSPAALAQYAVADQLIHSRNFLIGYNCLAVVVFCVVWLTRRHERLYYPRVFLYGMFLAGVLSEIATLLFPWRTI